MGIAGLVPPAGVGIAHWWMSVEAAFAHNDRKRVNSLVMLVMRTLWLERNARVFDQKCTSHTSVLSMMLDEWRVWLASRGGRTRGVG